MRAREANKKETCRDARPGTAHFSTAGQVWLVVSVRRLDDGSIALVFLVTGGKREPRVWSGDFSPGTWLAGSGDVVL